MKTVGFAVRNFAQRTGVNRYVRELLRRLPEAGFAPAVVAHSLPPDRPGRLEAVPWLPLSSWTRAASFDWFARRRLAALGAGLVHGQGDLTRQDVLTVNNCDAAAAVHVPDGRKPSPGTDYIRRRQFGPDGCRVVLVNSELVRRDVAEFYRVPPEKIRRIYFGVDLESFHPALRDAARRALLDAAGWPEETAVAVSVLSGDPAKRNFGLIAQAVEILARGRAAGLCVVGSMPKTLDPAARRIQDAGKLWHVPATSEVAGYLAAGDVFVLPAFYEEFGMTVLEALACGCPPVVSARCGAAELLTPGTDGEVIAELYDPAELVAGMAAALDSPGRREASRRTAEKYSWDVHVRELVKVYREF